MSSPPSLANGNLKHDQFRKADYLTREYANRTHHFKPEANNVPINPDKAVKGFFRSLSMDKKKLDRRNSWEYNYPPGQGPWQGPPSPTPVKSVSGTTPPLKSFYIPPSGLEGAPPVTYDHTQKTFFKSFDFKS